MIFTANLINYAENVPNYWRFNIRGRYSTICNTLSFFLSRCTLDDYNEEKTDAMLENYAASIFLTGSRVECRQIEQTAW